MRLFVGLPVPASPRYATVKGELGTLAPRPRPVPDGTEHVTLRFLGEVLEPVPVADALEKACHGRAALPCVVEGLGAFSSGFPPNKRARVLWAGVRAPGIEALAQAVRQATAAFGEPEAPRPFVAHATLARCPRPTDVRSVVDRHAATLFSSGVLDRVVLWRSDPAGEGSRYTSLHAVRLGSPDGGKPMSRPSPARSGRARDLWSVAQIGPPSTRAPGRPTPKATRPRSGGPSP